MSMIVLDLETTGLDPRLDKIIEIGMIRFDGAKVLETYQTLINPDRPIPPAITQLTHITNPMVTNAPHVLDVLDEVSEFVGSDAIVGHNVTFDLAFLRRYKILQKNRSTDTYELASVLLPRAGRYKLSALAEQFGIDADGKHRALADCTMTMKLYNKLIEKAYSLPFELLSALINTAGTTTWAGLGPLREVYSTRLKSGERFSSGKSFKLCCRYHSETGYGVEQSEHLVIGELLPDGLLAFVYADFQVAGTGDQKAEGIVGYQFESVQAIH